MHTQMTNMKVTKGTMKLMDGHWWWWSHWGQKEGEGTCLHCLWEPDDESHSISLRSMILELIHSFRWDRERKAGFIIHLIITFSYFGITDTLDFLFVVATDNSLIKVQQKIMGATLAKRCLGRSERKRNSCPVLSVLLKVCVYAFCFVFFCCLEIPGRQQNCILAWKHPGEIPGAKIPSCLLDNGESIVMMYHV